MAARAVYGILLSLVLLGTPTAASDVVDVAASYLGRPYVWGAEGPSAFDCSGLTQFAFREVGVDLPRRAISQSKVGETVGRWQRGDLLFFRNGPNEPWTVTHVGIYEGGRKMINASGRQGRVARESLDDPYWADRYMFARRVNEGVYTARDDRGESGAIERIPRSGPDFKRGAKKAAERVAEELLRQVFRRPR